MNKDFKLNNQNYDITPELRARKILEKETQDTPLLEFDENIHDKYGYDLEVYIWKSLDTTPTKDFRGFIEIEHSANKNFTSGSLPKSWSPLSFLKRKIYKYDYDNNEFLPERKTTVPTVYMKFNYDYSNCFSTSMKKLFNNGTESDRSDGSRKNSFINLDREYINLGLKESVVYIKNRFYDNGDKLCRII